MNHSIKYKVAQAALAFSLVVGGLSYVTAPTTYAAESSVVNQTREVTWGVNMRSGPSASYSSLGMISKGETITVIGQASNGWYNVTDARGNTGYISNDSKYTKLVSNGSSSNSTSNSNSNSSSNSGSSSNSSSSGSSNTSATEQSSSGTATIQKSVSFRTGPSTSYKRMRYLQAGEQVTVLGQTGSWYKVKDSSGTTGYVSSSSSYIKLGGSSSTGGSSSNGSSNSGSGSNTGSGSNSSDSGSSTSASASVEKVIAAGMKYLGTPYEYGSNRNTTTTFDCSDFVRQAFKDALGITLPGDSRKQGAYVKELGNAKTSISQLKRGDLMFFMSYKGSSKSSYSSVNKSTATITHVGIYLGDGKILHTYSKDSGGVRTDTITGKHWEYRFLYGGSALK